MQLNIFFETSWKKSKILKVLNFFLFFLVFLNPSIGLSDSERLFTYSPAFGEGDAFFIYFDENHNKYYLEFLPEHDSIPVYEAMVCPPKSAFVCVNSEIFFFSFPKILDSETKTWVFDESTFEIVDTYSISFEGKQNDFFTVDRYVTSDGRKRERFIYNSRLGLVSFGYIRIFPKFDKEPDFYGVIYYSYGKGFGANP